MAQFDIPKENRQGSITEFGQNIESLKSCQKAMDLIEKITPDIDELYHLIYLFDNAADFQNALLDICVYTDRAEQCLIDRAEKLKELIQIDS